MRRKATVVLDKIDLTQERSRWFATNAGLRRFLGRDFILPRFMPILPRVIRFSEQIITVNHIRARVEVLNEVLNIDAEIPCSTFHNIDPPIWAGYKLL